MSNKDPGGIKPPGVFSSSFFPVILESQPARSGLGYVVSVAVCCHPRAFLSGIRRCEREEQRPQQIPDYGPRE